jgi:CheY-like chemotaxis protein
MLPAQPKAHRILVVDDEPLMRESIKRALDFGGNLIETAATGKEALACFEKDKFDLLVLDYEMPDMRGDELALLVKALDPKQPIAMVTAYPKTLAGNLLTDVDSILSKPFRPQELREAALRLFAKR